MSSDAVPHADATPGTSVPGVAPVLGVVWDFGGVLIDWDPFPAVAAAVGEDEARRFFAEFDFATWNHAQDAGRTWDEALAVLERSHPHFLPHGRGYRTHFAHSLVGEIPGTAQILRDRERQNFCAGLIIRQELVNSEENAHALSLAP